jgi:hypothetical protein
LLSISRLLELRVARLGLPFHGDHLKTANALGLGLPASVLAPAADAVE